tara:strand:+ start:768 stop:965 length:198 start_codon:yes stop_codon:yes gene_type:complete
MTDAPNPPAFPVAGNENTFSEEGMLLRDWFASQVIGSLCNQLLSKDAVAQAYHLADLMLAERIKP